MLRSIIVDQLSRTGMALKLYPNRRWAQLLPLLNAHTDERVSDVYILLKYIYIILIRSDHILSVS